MEEKELALQRAMYSWVNTRNMQPIVDKISPLIWTDINIINAQGIIVASSKQYRIGKYHNAAKILIDSDMEELIIEHTNDVPGVLHGVNFPICIDDVRVGMIGITGVPTDVQLIAKLVQALLQVYISQARKEQEKTCLEQLRYSFLYDWLFNPKFRMMPDFEERGRSLGIHINDKWRVVVMIPQERLKFNDQYFEGIQQVIQHFLDDEGRHEQSIYVGESLLLLIKDQGENKVHQLLCRITGRLTDLYNCGFAVGIGRDGESCDGVRQSLKDARIACRKSLRDPQLKICSFDDLDMEALLALVPEKETKRLLMRIFSDYSDEELAAAMNMLEKYVKNNGSISKTADELHIHKNSLQYRLNKLAARTGYVPQNIAHMSLLYSLLLIYKEDLGDRSAE